MIGVPPKAFAVGENTPTGVKDLESVSSPEDLPTTARLVLLADGEHLEASRKRTPAARFLRWFGDRTEAEAIRAALEQGFDDVVVGEAHLERWLDRSLRDTRLVSAYAQRVANHAGITELVASISEQPGLQDVLRLAVLRMAELFAVDRVSVVLWKPGDDVGFVVMERDQSLDNLVIRFEDYPELGEIVRSGEPLVISDVLADSLLSGVRTKIEEARSPHRSAVLFPLKRTGTVVGALFLRGRQVAPVDEGLLSTGRLVASITSVAIGHALEQELLLSEQRELLRDRESATQQLAALKQFSALFEQAQDGILVTDKKGNIRYANQSAGAILLCDPVALKGASFMELLSPRSHVLAERAFEGDAVGDGYGYVDLLIPNEDDVESVISAAIRHLEEPEGVLISFRDVTELREIESELRQTKEFLENLIQSSVDAIVAADIRGKVILFNRAAEQILGYSARDVVGRMDIEDLYQPGDAEDVMRRLRSEAFGGRGRLERLRKDLVGKNEASVPVNLTAAIIYEGEDEVATVGIFTDLRERLKIEEKLSSVQRKLQLSERQAVAVELAGAAAHELNQPLTSIMGYAEMLKRRVEPDDRNHKPINVICRETERMAQIVKRIGQITSYQTTQYVGGSKILDLSGGDTDPTAAQTQEQDT